MSLQFIHHLFTALSRRGEKKCSVLHGKDELKISQLVMSEVLFSW